MENTYNVIYPKCAHWTGPKGKQGTWEPGGAIPRFSKAESTRALQPEARTYARRAHIDLGEYIGAALALAGVGAGVYVGLHEETFWEGLALIAIAPFAMKKTIKEVGRRILN